ncbi:MAG: hypothetical protein IJ105_03510 [Bacilli bacterium]|nr:hypothetical protein [Bacilli bacterium]
MKDNRGFATSFILFGLLVLFLIVMGVLLFTLGNSSVLNSKLKNKLTNDIETPNAYSEYNFYYTGDVQVFTAPKDRTYNIKAWSASSNYVSGKLHLKKGEKLYIYVGNSSYNSGNTDIRTIHSMNMNSTESINSIIMKAGYNSSDSIISSDKINDKIIKDSNNLGDDKNPSSTLTGYVRIYFYSITAANLGYNDTVSDKHCENVQCILDEIASMVKEKKDSK